MKQKLQELYDQNLYNNITTEYLFHTDQQQYENVFFHIPLYTTIY